jgi:hypothetical protein
MIDRLGAGDNFPHLAALGNLRYHEGQARMGPHSGQVLQTPGGKIIHDRHRMAASQKALDQMRPDKTSPASNEDI